VLHAQRMILISRPRTMLAPFQQDGLPRHGVWWYSPDLLLCPSPLVDCRTMLVVVLVMSQKQPIFGLRLLGTQIALP
jgi:hypothetical protein